MARNDGTYLQDEVWKALLQVQEKNAAWAHRFTDTKAARNIVAAQPADYMLMFRGTCYLIECKSTTVGTPLKALVTRSSVGRRQLAYAKKHVRAGGQSLFIHWNAKLNQIKLYDGSDITSNVWEPFITFDDIDQLHITLLRIFNGNR